MTSSPGTLIICLLFLAATTLWVQSALAGNPFAGEKIYARYCQTCHGPKGRGVMPTTPDFSWRGSANNGLGVLDRQLAIRIFQGKKTCPSFQGILSEADIMNVITHIRTLR